MKKIASVVLILSFLIFFENQVIAGKNYHSYKVIEVTEKTIILQRRKVIRNVTSQTKSYGRTITFSIDKSRRPYLKVGDRVRYNRKENRLGRTLPKK